MSEFIQVEAIHIKIREGNVTITYSVLISYCFALHPYEKHELIKPEWVIRCQNLVTLKPTFEHLSLSYQKRDGPVPARPSFFCNFEMTITKACTYVHVFTGQNLLFF